MNLGKNKKITIILALIVIFILGLVAFVKIKDRNGVVAKSTTDFPVNEKLISYRQDNAEWKADKIGNSKYDLESSGCVITSIATAISNSNMAMNPGELNQFLSENNVFDDNGNLQWGKIDELDGFYADVYSDKSSAIIDECLAAGHYPIVKIHRNTFFSYHHYVLVIGAENGDYICMDPLQDNLTKLSDYKNKIYAIRCVYYEK
jgi:hypothetical protein